MVESWKIDRYALALGSGGLVRRRIGASTELADKLCSSITVRAKDRDLSLCPIWLASPSRRRRTVGDRDTSLNRRTTRYRPVTQRRRTVELIAAVNIHSPLMTNNVNTNTRRRRRRRPKMITSSSDVRWSGAVFQSWAVIDSNVWVL